MPRLSSIDALPPEIRGEIGRLRQAGHTIDAILEHLRTLVPDEAPSRSALGRHIQGMDKLRERMSRSRQVAEALAAQLGDAPEGQAARLNIELMHGTILDFYRIEDEDGTREPATPKGVELVAKALDHLTKASKTNDDYMQAVEKRAKEIASEAVDKVAAAQGMTAATVEAIKAAVFGVVIST